MSYGSVEFVSLTVRIADPMVGRRQVFTDRGNRLGSSRRFCLIRRLCSIRYSCLIHYFELFRCLGWIHQQTANGFEYSPSSWIGWTCRGWPNGLAPDDASSTRPRHSEIVRDPPRYRRWVPSCRCRICSSCLHHDGRRCRRFRRSDRHYIWRSPSSRCRGDCSPHPDCRWWTDPRPRCHGYW